MRVAPGPSPSAEEYDDLIGVVETLAEEIEEGLTLGELLEIFAKFCNHPVTLFARRLCDLVPHGVDDDA